MGFKPPAPKSKCKQPIISLGVTIFASHKSYKHKHIKLNDNNSEYYGTTVSMRRGFTIIILICLQKETLFPLAYAYGQKPSTKNSLEVCIDLMCDNTNTYSSNMSSNGKYYSTMFPCREDPVQTRQDPIPYAVRSKSPVLPSRPNAADKKRFERVMTVFTSMNSHTQTHSVGLV